MGSGRRCNAIGQSSAIEAATVVSLSEASSMHFEEMAPETLGQAHAEQLHFVSGHEQKRTRPLSLVESSLTAEILLSTTSRVSVR